MKKISFLLLMVVFMGKLFAQSTGSDSLPAYKRFPNIPPFTLVGIDSAKVSRDDIPKHKKVMLMYFSPECEHCQHQTQDIINAMNGFKDIEIVMMTYQPYEEMVDFYKRFELAKYPNIKIGRDTKFFFPPFYRMQSLPYLALYDKKGNLITTFEGNRKPEKILKAFDNKLD